MWTFLEIQSSFHFQQLPVYCGQESWEPEFSYHLPHAKPPLGKLLLSHSQVCALFMELLEGSCTRHKSWKTFIELQIAYLLSWSCYTVLYFDLKWEKKFLRFSFSEKPPRIGSLCPMRVPQMCDREAQTGEGKIHSDHISNWIFSIFRYPPINWHKINGVFNRLRKSLWELTRPTSHEAPA